MKTATAAATVLTLPLQAPQRRAVRQTSRQEAPAVAPLGGTCRGKDRMSAEVKPPPPFAGAYVRCCPPDSCLTSSGRAQHQQALESSAKGQSRSAMAATCVMLVDFKATAMQTRRSCLHDGLPERKTAEKPTSPQVWKRKNQRASLYECRFHEWRCLRPRRPQLHLWPLVTEADGSLMDADAMDQHPV